MTRYIKIAAHVAVALVLAACSSAVEREALALKKGDAYFAAENFDKARVEYRNALQLVPNDGEARLRNGLVLEKLGQLREAAQFYIGALEVKPTLIEARTRLARIYVIGGVPDRALEVLKPGLDQNPDDAGLLGMRAAARARLRQTAEALADAEAAAKRDPRDEYVIAVLAGLYAGNDQSAKAEALLERAIAELPKSVDLRLALAQLELSLDRQQRTEALLREVVVLRPNEAAHRVRLAQFLATHGKSDAAQQMLVEARTALPKDMDVRNAMIEFLAANRGREVAESELRHMAAAEPDQVDVKFALASFYVQGKEYARAEVVLRDLINSEGTHPAGLTARTRLAALRLANGDAASAEKLADEVLDRSPRDADALVLRGNIRLSKGDAKAAIEDLRAASRDLPNAQPVLRALAQAHLRNAEPGLAEETLRRAVDSDPGDAQTRMDLVNLLLQSGRRDEAATMLRVLSKERPGDIAVQTAAMHAALESHDLPFAHAVLESVRQIKGEDARAALFAGLLAEAEGHVEDAVKAYRAALLADPAAREALIQASNLLLAQKRNAEAFKLLDDVGARVPTYALPATLKGDALLASRDFPGAEQAYRAAIARAPRWWMPYRGLAYIRVGQGDVAAAVRSLQESAVNVDEAWRLHADAGQLLDLSGHPEEAIAAYERAYAAGGTGLPVVNNLAMLLVTARKDDASIKRAVALVAPLEHAANPQFLDTFGWVRYRGGDVAAGLAALERAAQGGHASPVVLYHLGVLQEASGQRDRAIASLQSAISGKQTFPGAADAVAALARLNAGR